MNHSEQPSSPENRLTELNDEAIADLDKVMGTALGVAREQLESAGAFLPFGIALEKPSISAAENSGQDDDAATVGELRLLAVQPTEDPENPDADLDADAMMDDLVALMREQEDLYLAVALISDVTLLEEDRDAIHVNAEHRDGGAVGAVSAYTAPAEEDAEWVFDEPQVDSAERLVWTD